VSAPTGAVKFTVKSDSQELEVTADETQVTQSGATLEFGYTNATTGTNQYISCVLLDGDDVVAYYGKLADSSSDASGNLSIPLEDVANGTYTLQIFSEEANGDNFTDFCSEPVSMTLNVTDGVGEVSDFGGTELDTTAPVLSVGSADRTASAAAEVSFSSDKAGTYYWQIDGAAPASAAALVNGGASSDTLISGVNTKEHTGLAEGAHTIYIAAKDAAGNVSNILTISIPAYGVVQEQFTLAPGGTYYFDLSAQGMPGTVNTALPDTTLKWAPFTYAGTVNAYSLDAGSSNVTDASDSAVASDRSLFVADYNISHTISWDELKNDTDGDFIFGKAYSSGGVDYNLRSLSAGSATNGQSEDNDRGTPGTNEWDQLLNKNGAFIKNWSGIFSWGQDTASHLTFNRAFRGYIFARVWESDGNKIANPYQGWRPALEIRNPDTLGPDGLKTVTYDMDGNGTLGAGALASATVVYTGSFTLPEITEENGFNYTGSAGPLGWYDGSTFYESGTVLDSLASGTTLTAGVTPTVFADSITVTATGGADSVQVESTLQMLADVLPANATDRGVTWSVTNGTGSATINSAGLLKATGVGTITVTATAYDGYGDITITVTAPVTTYTVTFNSNGSVYTTKTVNAGQSIGSAAWPADPTRNSYIFAGWFTGENGTGTQFTSTTPIDAAMTVYAKWTYSGGGGSPSDDGGTSSATPTYNAEVNTGSVSNTTLPVNVDKNRGTASIDLGSQKLTSAGTVITIPSIPDVGTYSVGIPAADLSAAEGQGMLTLNTDAGSVTVSSNMLTGVDGINGSKAQISVGQGDKSTLPADVKAAIGGRPLIQLTLSVDGKQTDWSNPDAPVTVRIPYTPTTAELQNSESIVIWYIDGNGNAVSVPNGRYDVATGTVVFSTTHFSDYAVVYNKVSFDDVSDTAWYSDAVGFISARGITTGTGNCCYSPDVKLTRGEFIVMLMRAYNIAPDEIPTENFSDAGSTYYTSYLATAKRLGISAGIGNNLLAPEQAITRQEMFTLLYNTLKVIGQLPEGSSSKTLTDFTDAGQIDSWAEDAMTLLVETETVRGHNGALTPLSTTTRAEMAQVLYNLFAK